MLVIYRALLAGIGAVIMSSAAVAADLPAPVKAKMALYSAKLVEWAATPAIVSAVKDANAKGGPIPGMSNAKWDDLADDDHRFRRC